MIPDEGIDPVRGAAFVILAFTLAGVAQTWWFKSPRSPDAEPLEQQPRRRCNHQVRHVSMREHLDQISDLVEFRICISEAPELILQVWRTY